MLVANEFRVPIGERKSPAPPPPPPVNYIRAVKMGMCATTLAMAAVVGNGGEVEKVRVLSHESEHDLGMMVSDFLENGNGSSGGESYWYSSDSESGLADIHHLAERILFWKRTVEQYESDMSSAVNSLIVSIKESDLQVVAEGQCNGSCIRQSLVKRLTSSGYDASICSSKWNGDGKFPGGDHEYIDVISTVHNNISKRVIVDIDFQSHFEIARAVESYEAILATLPVVYVGSLERLNQFLQIMAEATRWSLKQNSMPLPPWRSLPYLQSKWHSPYKRKSELDEPDSEFEGPTDLSDHFKCIEYLKSLKTSLWSEMDVENFSKHSMASDKKSDKKGRMLKLDRKQRPSLLSS